MKVLVLVLVLALIAGAELRSLEKRITGIKTSYCYEEEGQHQVMLSTKPVLDQNWKNKRQYREVHCGGTLISSEWILTAAHCNIPDLVVLMGRLPDTAVVRDIEQTEKYPDQDLMLLKLKTDTNPLLQKLKTDTNQLLQKLKTVTNQQNPHIAQLPDHNCKRPDDNNVVDIYGWQDAFVDIKNKMHFYNAGTRRCGKMNVVPCTCPSKFGQTFCGSAPDVDGNQGDSGSGVFWNNKLYGVLVMGDNTFCTGPTDFMNICHPDYRQWIKKFTGK